MTGVFIGLLIWTALALLVGLVIGASLRTADKQMLKQHRRQVSCACGCGRRLDVSSQWDGMHGPDSGFIVAGRRYTSEGVYDV